MRFYVKVAPGVRLTASSRGLRASVGPRIARLHVGSGRPGVSTGAGPVSFYQSLGTPVSRAVRSGGAGPSGKVAGTAPSQKQHEADRITERLRDIVEAPSAPVAHARAPERTATVDMPEANILRRHQRLATRGVPLWAVRRRRLAYARAQERANAEIAEARGALESQQAAAHLERMVEWEALLTNDPDTVLGQLARAFEDNEARAAALGVEDDRVLIAVLVPHDDVVPDRMPGTTSAGNLSLRKTTKAERATWYLRVVCGALTYTAREAFAVAPGLGHAQLVAVRPGDEGWEAVLAADLAVRSAAVLAHSQEPMDLLDVADEVVRDVHGRSLELRALAPDSDEAVAEVLAQLNSRSSKER